LLPRGGEDSASWACSDVSSSVTASMVLVPSPCWVTFTTLSPGSPNSSVVASTMPLVLLRSECVATLRFQEAGFCRVSHAKRFRSGLPDQG
jgi:hypothetical protein